MKHRMTVQYDAKLTFDLNLPPDDDRLVEERTPIAVVVDPAERGRDDCSKYVLKIRVGEGDDAADYEQVGFVHRSAATGAASCLIQYLAAKPGLNVIPGVVGPEPLGLETDVSIASQSFVAVGWQMAKVEHGHVLARHAERAGK